MKKEISFVPVGKVLNVINSCETEDQMDSCEKLIDNYVDLIKNKGVVNSKDVRERLYKELQQKKFSVGMIKEHLINETIEAQENGIEILERKKYAEL